MNSPSYEKPTPGECVKNLARVVFGIPVVLLWFGWMLTFGLVIALTVFLLTECFGWGRDENGDPTGGLKTFLEFNNPLIFGQTEGHHVRPRSPESRRSRSLPSSGS